MAKINRQQVLEKYGQKCGYCGKEINLKSMQVDHILPVWTASIYGHLNGVVNINSFDNLMPSCRLCNHYKRSDNLEQFREKMTTLHQRVCSSYIAKVAQDYGIVQIKPFDGKFYFEKIQGEQ